MPMLLKSVFRIIGMLVALFVLFTVFLLFSGGRVPSHDSTSARISRANSDLRSMVSAIESYRAEHATNPSMRRMTEIGYSLEDIQEARAEGLSIVDPGAPNRPGLTTPVAYISSLYKDLLDRQHTLPYAYWTDGSDRFMIYSTGPDGHFNIQHPQEETRRTTHSLEIVNPNLVYDPSNGTVSEGDLVRFSEVSEE